jgi:hypothetical protein
MAITFITDSMARDTLRILAHSPWEDTVTLNHFGLDTWNSAARQLDGFTFEEIESALASLFTCEV